VRWPEEDAGVVHARLLEDSPVADREADVP